MHMDSVEAGREMGIQFTMNNVSIKGGDVGGLEGWTDSWKR